MPLDYHIDQRENRVTLHGIGTITDTELVACIRRLRADPALCTNMPALADLRGAGHLEVTSDGLREMLAVMEATADPESTAKVAILTVSEAHAAMARLLEALAEAHKAQVRYRTFSAYSDAEGWLAEP